jgi:hypothetical protein
MLIFLEIYHCLIRALFLAKINCEKDLVGILERHLGKEDPLLKILKRNMLSEPFTEKYQFLLQFKLVIFMFS